MVFYLSSATYLDDSYIELSMFVDVDQTTTSKNTVKTTSKITMIQKGLDIAEILTIDVYIKIRLFPLR